MLVVSPWGPWREASGDTLILRHHLDLLSDRHDITLLVSEAAPPGFRLPRVEVVAGPDPRSAGVDYIRRRIRALATGEPAHVYWTQRRGLLGAFDRAVGTGAVDVVHLFGWGTASLVARARGIPVVHMPVDHWQSGHANRTLPTWRQLADVGEERAIRRHEVRWYPQADAVVVVAPLDAQRIRADSPHTHVHVVPNGVDAGPAPGQPVDEPVLTFHGAFETRANVDAAVCLVRDVLPLVRRSIPSARVLLVGRDPSPEVAALAGPSVTVTGAVPVVREALSGAAVYVAPMTSGSGMKNKVLEAMAAGLPVVGLPLGVSGIGAGEGVAVAASAAGVADEVVRLLTDTAARHTAGQTVRARVERDFTWASSAAAIEQLWFDVSARKGTAVSGGPSRAG